MTTLRWLVLFTSVVVYRVWFPETPPPPAMRLDYDLLLIALVGLYRGAPMGTMVGWGIGLLAYATDPGRLAWGGLLGACLGWSVGVCKERLFLEYAVSRWLVFWLVLMVYKLFYLVLVAGGDWGLWFTSLWSGGLASAGLSATVGVVVSLLWERARPRQVSAGGAMMMDESI